MYKSNNLCECVHDDKVTSCLHRTCCEEFDGLNLLSSRRYTADFVGNRRSFDSKISKGTFALCRFQNKEIKNSFNNFNSMTHCAELECTSSKINCTIFCQEFEMDPGIRRELERQTKDRIELVKRELAWEAEKHRIALEKLEQRYVVVSVQGRSKLKLQ